VKTPAGAFGEPKEQEPKKKYKNSNKTKEELNSKSSP